MSRKTYICGKWPITRARIEAHLNAWRGTKQSRVPFAVMAMQMLVDELQARGVVDYGPPDPAAAPWLTGLRWQDMVKEINAMERPQDVFGEGELQWILALTATAAREPAEHLLTPAQMTRLTRLYSSVQGIEQF